MRGVRGIAHEHDRGRHIRVDPRAVRDPQEVDPRRSAQMARVGHQRVPVEIAREELFAEGDTLFGRHPVETGGAPDLLRRFDDERRRLAVELVRVRLKPAPLGLLERERERVEQSIRTEPDVAALAPLDRRLEHVRVLAAQHAVDAVARDDQVLRAERHFVGDIGFEHQAHAERLAAALQDVQQALAPDAAEAVSARADRAALEVDVDVVPVIERVADLGVRFGLGESEVAERLVGEHDAPAECVVGPIALDYGDLPARVRALGEQREVEAGRTAAHAQDAHRRTHRWPAKYFDMNILNLN
jgi:hypothetical protein